MGYFGPIPSTLTSHPNKMVSFDYEQKRRAGKNGYDNGKPVFDI